MNIQQLKDMIAFFESKPKEEEYNFWIEETCAIKQFADTIGKQYWEMDFGYSPWRDASTLRLYIGNGWDINAHAAVSPAQKTFGAAAIRGRQYLARVEKKEVA